MTRLGIFVLLCGLSSGCGGNVEASPITDGGTTSQIVYMPCTVQFSGVATGYQNGWLLRSTLDPASGNWWLSMVVNKGAYSNASNIKSIDLVGLAIRGGPRAGSFDFDSSDLLESSFFLTLDDGTEHGTELAAYKAYFDDGGVSVVGATTLVVTSVTPLANGTLQISGSLDANLMKNDGTTATAAEVHIKF